VCTQNGHKLKTRENGGLSDAHRRFPVRRNCDCIAVHQYISHEGVGTDGEVTYREGVGVFRSFPWTDLGVNHFYYGGRYVVCNSHFATV
jgi:hypothetical protein